MNEIIVKNNKWIKENSIIKIDKNEKNKIKMIEIENNK